MIEVHVLPKIGEVLTYVSNTKPDFYEGFFRIILNTDGRKDIKLIKVEEIREILIEGI